MKPKISMRQSLSDPKLLGHVLQGDSWFGWRVLLIAAAGEKLTGKERAEVKRLTGRSREPGKMVRELICIFGRRAGKTLALGVFDCWVAALCDHRDRLVRGEIGIALVISRDQRAATVTLNYIDGILRGSAVLSRMIVNRTADAIELTNGIRIEVRPCNRVSVRGVTCVSVVAEELAHWFTSADFANPDHEVLGAARPTLLTTRGPVLIASSVYAKHGVLFDSFKKYYGPDGPPDILVAYGTSRDANPSLLQEEIDREIERDPVLNRAEYLSEWRVDTEGFILRATVEACVGDYRELEPRPNVVYVCFVDPASGSENGDSYAIAIAHKETGGQIVIDCVREICAPFSPSAVVASTVVPLCRAYGIIKVYGDNYAGEFAKEPLRDAGVYYSLWKQHKSALYCDPLLSLLNSKHITLPRNDRLVSQCCTLERSVKRSGRDEITHPAHGHDDLINAVAGAAAVARSAWVEEAIIPSAPELMVLSDAPRPGESNTAAYIRWLKSGGGSGGFFGPIGGPTLGPAPGSGRGEW